MAIQQVNEIHQDRDYDSDTSPNTRLTRVWRIIGESGDEPLDIINDASLPAAKGDPHPSESRALVQRIELRQEDPDDFNWVYLFRAEYATAIVGPPGGEEENENPLLDPISVQWGHELVSYPLEAALDPVDRTTVIPVVNSANQEFDPAVVVPYSVRVLTIEKNLSSFNPTFFDFNYVNRVNSNTFYGYGADEVWLESVDANLQYRGTTPYWRARYTFKVSPFEWGWRTDVLDQGTYQLKDDKYQRATDENGDPVVEPILLDGNGRSLHEVNAVRPLPRSASTYLQFWPYYQANFSALNVGG